MELVRNLPQQYRQDPWVLALADTILGVLEGQNADAIGALAVSIAEILQKNHGGRIRQ